MLDLKPYFDAVQAANAEVQRVANELDTLFREGSEESTAKALEMRAELDDAQRKQDEAVKLYESMQLANRPNDVAKNFVPVSDTETEAPEGGQPSVIKRADYDRMDLVARAQFIRLGGKLED